MRTRAPAATRPGADHAGQHAEVLGVRGASRWRSSSGHFSWVSGSRVGIAQRSHGADDLQAHAALSSTSAPAQPSSAQGGASRSRWRLGRKRRRSISVPSSLGERGARWPAW